MSYATILLKSQIDSNISDWSPVDLSSEDLQMMKYAALLDCATKIDSKIKTLGWGNLYRFYFMRLIIPPRLTESMTRDQIVITATELIKGDTNINCLGEYSLMLFYDENPSVMSVPWFSTNGDLKFGQLRVSSDDDNDIIDEYDSPSSYEE